METFEFEGFWKCESKCGVTIQKNEENLTVILTELNDNPGTSITNAFEMIATRLYNERFRDRNPWDIKWIENYPARHHREETFDEVSLHWDGSEYNSPVWRRLDDFKMEGYNEVD